MRVEDLSTYEIIEKRQIPDINSVTYLCRHKKTGARVALVSNDDENKVFYIGFRTTPKDSTGAEVKNALSQPLAGLPYSGTFRIMRIEGIPGEGSFCGTGKGVSEHFLKCHDLSGQDCIPRG